MIEAGVVVRQLDAREEFFRAELKRVAPRLFLDGKAIARLDAPSMRARLADAARFFKTEEGMTDG